MYRKLGLNILNFRLMHDYINSICLLSKSYVQYPYSNGYNNGFLKIYQRNLLLEENSQTITYDFIYE